MKNPWDVENNNSNNSSESKEKNITNIESILKKAFNNFNNKPAKNNNQKISNSKNLFLVIFLFCLFTWLFSGIYKVNSDENAIISYLGKYYETTSPGLHFYLPYPFGKVKKASVARINKEEFGFSSLGNKDSDEESLMLTGDENIADIDFEVQWKISNIRDYLYNIKDPIITIRGATESVMREIIANSKIDDILANKKFEIENSAKDLLQNILNSYNSGIEIITVQLLRADPPKEVISAFRDVQTAKSDKERKINEAHSYSNDILPKARGEAEALLQEAEGYRKAIVSKAEGETSRFNKIYDEYKNNKEITKKRIYLETIEEVMKNNDKIIIDKETNGNFIHLLNK